jgi:hypothetical protein
MVEPTNDEDLTVFVVLPVKRQRPRFGTLKALDLGLHNGEIRSHNRVAKDRE